MKGELGFWVQMHSLDVVHIFCNSEIDWICLDYEHGLFCDEFLSNAVKLIRANKIKAAFSAGLTRFTKS